MNIDPSLLAEIERRLAPSRLTPQQSMAQALRNFKPSGGPSFRSHTPKDGSYARPAGGGPISNSHD